MSDHLTPRDYAQIMYAAQRQELIQQFGDVFPIATWDLLNDGIQAAWIAAANAVIAAYEEDRSC